MSESQLPAAQSTVVSSTSPPSEAGLPAAEDAVVLPPNYSMSLGLGAIALPITVWQPWQGGPLVLLAAFLGLQTTRIRLVFTARELEVRLGDRLLRQFPYAEWSNWTIFWRPVPILFYFREVNSIHFLPILFSPSELTAQLTQHVPLGHHSASSSDNDYGASEQNSSEQNS